MKRVLVTGAGGYVGRHLLDGLAERGFEVHAVSRDVQQSRKPVFWHTADLLSEASIDSLVKEVAASHLIHLAWVTEHASFWTSPQNTEWQLAGEHLLRSFVQSGGSRAVLAGTCAEYAATDGPCIENVTALRGESLYAKSKLAFRDAAFALAHDTDLQVAWARVFFSFGPHEPEGRLVPDVVNSLLKGHRAKCGDGSLIRDFMYVKDVAGAMAATLDSEFVGDINIASGHGVTLESLVARIADRLDATGRVDFGSFPRRPGDLQQISADNSQLIDTIGWAPEYDLGSAIDETIAWWQEQAE